MAFVGLVNLAEKYGATDVTVLRLRTISGRREIALEDERKRGTVKFALKTGSSLTPEGGYARERLLEWVHKIGAEQRIKIKEVFWDMRSKYWIEISGERIAYDGPLSPLEFKA